MSLRKRGRGTRAKSARGEEWDELLDDAARARRRVRPSEQIDALCHLFDDPGLAGVDLAAAAVVINVTSARYAVFNYEAASDKFAADSSPVNCGTKCHVAVKAKDYIFHPYQKR